MEGSLVNIPTAQIIEIVLAYLNAYTAKNIRMTERHLAELRVACKGLAAIEPGAVEPVGSIEATLGDEIGYDVAVTDDDGKINLRLHESADRDVAVSMTFSQTAQMRRDLLRAMLRLASAPA